MQDKIRGWVFTLEVVEKELPAHASPVHRERLREMREYFERRLKEGLTT